jgi:hypothetical protein
MSFAKRLLLDVEGALDERLGLFVFPLLPIESRQVVEIGGDELMIFA